MVVSPEQPENAKFPIDVSPFTNVNKTVCSPSVSKVYSFVTSYSVSSTIIELNIGVSSLSEPLPEPEPEPPLDC